MKKPFSFRLDEGLVARGKAEAEARGVSLTKLLEWALEEKLDGTGSDQPRTGTNAGAREASPSLTGSPASPRAPGKEGRLEAGRRIVDPRVWRSPVPRAPVAPRPKGS